MVEWSITAVLKTAVPKGTGGSNPSLSAIKGVNQRVVRFAPFITPKNLRVIKHSTQDRTLDVCTAFRFIFYFIECSIDFLHRITLANPSLKVTLGHQPKVS